MLQDEDLLLLSEEIGDLLLVGRVNLSISSSVKSEEVEGVLEVIEDMLLELLFSFSIPQIFVLIKCTKNIRKIFLYL